jgi:cytochrome P450
MSQDDHHTEIPTHDTEPPTHDGLPIIGNTHQLVRQQDGLYEAAAKDGDVVRLDLLGLEDFYQINHPDLVEGILVSDSDRFRKASLMQEDLVELLGQGLILSEGELWERQRERIEPAFYMDRIADYAETMTAAVRGAVDDWADATTVDIEAEMKGLTLRILGKSMFGSELDYEARGLPEIVADLHEPGIPSNQPIAKMVPKWVPIPMWRRYKQGIRDIESLIEEFVEARRAADPDARDDLLSMLLTATDDDGETMSDTLVRDEMMTFLFAGHETTATALTFTWYLLAQNPDVQERLAAELEAVLDDDDATFDDMPDLEYTERVLREGMRIYPPIPSLQRETTEPLTLGGYALPEGATVSPMQWTIHRDERFWDAPLEFRPDRFADTDDRPDFAYFPFGGGSRRCLGQQFAIVEGTLILATLAHNYHLELVSDPDVDLSLSISTRPLDPIEMRVEPRE